MAKKMSVWFDREGDFLEFTFSRKKGSFKEVGDGVYERVDKDGNVLGYAVFNFLKRKSKKITISIEGKRLAIGRG
jgi:hypothetical protein